MTASDEIERTLQMTAWRQQLKKYCNIVVTEIMEVSKHGHYADVDEDAGKVDEVSIKKISKGSTEEVRPQQRQTSCECISSKGRGSRSG